MNNPKISIIVPIYNVEKYLKRCMDSLLHQTLTNIEIILVDDGSPDHCPAMCDEYVRLDHRVKVVHKENGGLGFARNSGLEIATGEFVAFVDSDDFVTLSAYEVFYRAAKTNNADAVFSNFCQEISAGRFEDITEISEENFLKGKDAVVSYLFEMIGLEPAATTDRRYSMSVWHGIYSLDIIQRNDIRFTSERLFISEDILFHIDFLSKSNQVKLITAYTYSYCLNQTSLTKTFIRDRYKKYIVLHKELERRLSDIYPEEKWRNSIDRLFLGYLRRNMIVTNNRLNIRDYFRLVKSVCNNKYVQQVLKRYPYDQMPLKYSTIYKYIYHSNILTLFMVGWLKKYLRK